MIKIRHNVFETNSSSTHSLVVAVKSEFDRWVKGETYYCNCWWREGRDKDRFTEGKFYPVAEVDAYCEDTGVERDPYELCTYDEFLDTESMETKGYSYETPAGETIRILARYGFDG